MDYKELTKSYKKELIDNLKGFCAINSEFDEKSVDNDNPFGKGVTSALKYFEALAKKDNFKVTNHKNMVVEVTIGEGKKNVTIMAHADVVPAGEGWDQDPFVVKEKDGELLGRGVADDKGPLLSCYYGLKALRDNNLLGDYKVRFLVGGNEESGSRGMAYYFNELKMDEPTYGFSPDANFPVIYAEKGMIGFIVHKKINISGLIYIKGGMAPNAVISHCKIVWKKDDDFISYLKKNVKEYELKENEDTYEITFIGQSAHGSVPWMGVNAGLIALNTIYGYTGNQDIKAFLDTLSEPRGKGVNADYISKEMEDCTNSLNVGLIWMEEDELKAVIDFRHVSECNYEGLKPKIEKALNEKGLDVTFGSHVVPLFYPKDSPLISTLYKIYQEETGDYETKPLAIGGGTYAKLTKNVVAYGLEMPGVDAKMHAPGEHIKIDTLYLGMAIYARAIYELGKIIEHEN